MQLTRRSMLSLALINVMPPPIWADEPDCIPLVPGLSLCSGADWTLATVTDGGAVLTHLSGITGSVALETSLTDDAMIWARWQHSHAPISARAQVLKVDSATIDGRFATTAAYLPRHSNPPAVIALTGHVGAGIALRVSTQEIGETYTDAHRTTHASLLAALKLDQAE